MSSQAYTPGLKVKSVDIIRRLRTLPMEGEVLVEKGQHVNADTPVARTKLPGEVQVLSMSDLLNLISREKYAGVDDITGLSEYRVSYDLEKFLTKKEGDEVHKDEVLGIRKSIFSTKIVKSPISGTIERISDFSGQVFIRGLPIRLEIDAYIPGKIVNTFSNIGVEVETRGAFVQGIFGIGGETRGKLMMLASSFDEAVEENAIGSDCTGKILIGGCVISKEALQRAVQVGANGVIVGGIECNDLVKFMGYDIGVAITGHEGVGLTLIITEGFGKMNMSKKTFSLLKKFDGKFASLNGATQIRAGVIRPEVIIPIDEPETDEPRKGAEASTQGLLPGITVRIIREPYFGAFGRVVSLPSQLFKSKTESEVRVLEAELEDGRRIVVPRANVEIIEE